MATFKFGNNGFSIVDGKITTDSSPDCDSGGATFNTGTSDGFAFTLKNDDVNHGMSTAADVNSYLLVSKADNSNGGLSLKGYTGATVATDLQASGTTPDTTTTTSSFGMLQIRGYKKSGTSITGVTGTENICVTKAGNTTRFIYQADGTAYADVAWSAFSDGRLKTDQVELTYGLDEIMQLEPKKYTRHSGHFDEGGDVVFDGDGWDSIGFIAQAVKEIIPEAIPTNDDPTKSFYGLNYIKLIPVIVKAIQELQENKQDK